MVNKPGWSKLESDLKLVLEKVDLKLEKTFTNEHGLVKLVFEPTEDRSLRILADILSWYYERQFVKACQECGKWGTRRKDLPSYPTLCHPCYVMAYNQFHESQEKE